MSQSDKIRFAGDVSIDNITIVTSKGMKQNITNQVLSIEVFEDLFAPLTSGIITVRDSFDFVNLLPFVGEELVNIKLFTPSLQTKDYIDQQYYVYKITDRLIEGDRTVLYQLHFISKEAIADANKKISKCYEGKISDIAKTLFENKAYGLETTKKLNIETTANNTKFIANYWSPFKSLKYISDTATSKTGSANYITYENRYGLNFVSLESLYNQPVAQEFVYDQYARDIRSDGSSVFNLNEDYKRIIDIDIPILQDYLDRTKSGMYASKLITNDILTKTYSLKNFDVLVDYEQTYHLNNHAPVSSSNIRSPNSAIINMPKGYGVFNGYTDVSNASSIQRRISQLQQAQTTKINITVLGRTDYTVGMKVKVTLNKIEPIKKSESNDDIIDKILSGNYIVSAINHRINREKHTCSMELIKDSYMMNLNGAK